MTDVVDTGPERRPVGRAAYVAGATVLALLATAGLARSLRDPGSHPSRAVAADASASATPSGPPLETRYVNPRTPPRSIDAPEYDGTVHVTFATRAALLAGNTTAQGLDTVAAFEGDAPATGYLPLAHGFVVVEETGSTARLLVHGPDGEVGLPRPGGVNVVRARGADEFWAVRMDGVAERFDVAGRRLGRVRLPVTWRLAGGTRHGLVATSDGGGIALFSENGRMVRLIAAEGTLLAVGPDAVAWADVCPEPACEVHVDDLGTGKWHDPQMGGVTVESAAFSPDGRSIAFTGQSGGLLHAYVYDPAGEDTAVLCDSAFGLLTVDWVDATRVAVVERLDVTNGVYVWDTRAGSLAHAETYPVDEPFAVDVGPA